MPVPVAEFFRKRRGNVTLSEPFRMRQLAGSGHAWAGVRVWRQELLCHLALGGLILGFRGSRVTIRTLLTNGVAPCMD